MKVYIEDQCPTCQGGKIFIETDADQDCIPDGFDRRKKLLWVAHYGDPVICEKCGVVGWIDHDFDCAYIVWNANAPTIPAPRKATLDDNTA